MAVVGVFTPWKLPSKSGTFHPLSQLLIKQRHRMECDHLPLLNQQSSQARTVARDSDRLIYTFFLSPNQPRKSKWERGHFLIGLLSLSCCPPAYHDPQGIILLNYLNNRSRGSNPSLGINDSLISCGQVSLSNRGAANLNYFKLKLISLASLEISPIKI